MSSLATLGGTRATSARVSMPAWGRWHADVSLDGEVPLTGAVELVIADLTLKGTILSGGPFQGRSSYRVVAGAGGWGKTIDAWSYSDDAGVKVATILGDAAQKAGETLASIAGTLRMAETFARREGPACRVLQQVAPNAWYIDEAGVTHLGLRPSVPFAGKYTVESKDIARQVVKVASESIAQIVPGAVVEGIEAIDVMHEISPDGLRSTVMGKRGAQDSDQLAVLRRIFEQLDPNRDFRGTWEYRVVELHGKRVDLQPERVSSGMPDLNLVTVRPGVAGCDATLPLGARVLVTFIDADPSRPVVTSFEDAEGEGFHPTALSIDVDTLLKLGQGALPVARATDLAGGIWPIAPSQTKVLA